MTIRKYLAAVAIAVAQAKAARAVFVGRLAFYAVLLVMYARIWEMVGRQGALGVFGHGDLIWYLAVTEWIALSAPPLHTDIEADVRSGNVAYLLPRPVSYLWLRFSEALGTMLARMLVLGVFGFGLAMLLTRVSTTNGASVALPSGGLLALVCGALTAVVAATLNLVFCAIIGLSAFFIEDTSPIYWVWQKLSFVFGGLMFPLDIYPPAMRSIANVTPFPSLLYAPGRIAIGAEPAFVWRTVIVLAAWTVFGVTCAHFAFRRALKALEINGG
jgi:ABC-2 type transport system permease protein